MYDSEKCYITNNLYYPKKYLNVPFVLNTCKYKSGKKDIVLARETENHIIFPRHYYSKKEIEENDIEIVEEEITFPRIGFKSKIKWRSDSQRLAHDSFSRAENGILNLNPAKGKTVQAIKKIEELGVPTLIVVHNSYLAEQWRRRIEDPNICLEWNGEIGKIGDGEFNWKHEVCIATIQTLISRLKRGTLPLEEFKNWFGCIIYDEVHHLGAAEFSQVGDLCWGNRYGLSATSRRVDNMDLVVRAHIDGIIYSDLTWDLFPEVFFKKTPSLFKDMKYIPKVLTDLSNHNHAIDVRIQGLRADLEMGYKIIAVADRLELLYSINNKLESCVVDASIDPFRREDLIKENQLSLVIGKLGKEGLDVDTLDCLHILTPISADYSYDGRNVELLGNQISQLLGRILRYHPNKKPPKVVIYWDYMIPSLNKLSIQLMKWFDKKMIKYTII